MINYKLKINFQDERILSSDITFVSGDISAYKLIFDFYDNGKKVDASKYTLTVKVKRSDGVKIASAGTIEDGQAVFVPESNIYAVPGDLYLEIALCDATGKYITTKIIIATVIEGLGETDVKGTEVPSVYVTLLSKLQYQIDQANQLVNESIPVKGEDYFDGKDGIDGKDGYTPVKGVDYFTEEEMEELEQKIVDALPEPVGQKIKVHNGEFFVDGGEIFNDYENNVAQAEYSHAEGHITWADAVASHVEGCGTYANGFAQHVQGKFNNPITDMAHIVGGGTEEMPKNIHTLDWNGTGWFAGEIKIGGAGQDDPEAQTLATKNDIDKIVNEITSALDELHEYAEGLIGGGQ